jgi:hypothetical protein
MTSPVSLDLDGVPLRRTLQLALSQLGLVYFVDDGILVITSQESEDQGLRPTSAGPSPFMSKQDKAERGEMSIEELEKFSEELKVRTEVMKQLNVLQNLELRGGDGQRVKNDQVDALIKEMKTLIDQIKSERQKAKTEGSK